MELIPGGVNRNVSQTGSLRRFARCMAAMPMFMRRFISIHGCMVGFSPLHIIMSTPAGPVYMGYRERENSLM